MRFSKTLENTLPGTDNNVMPGQLLPSVKSLFGSGMMIPFLRSTGVASCCQTMLHTLVRCGIMEPEEFNSSGSMLSTPAAFPFFSCLTSTLTYSSETESVFTGNCRLGWLPIQSCVTVAPGNFSSKCTKMRLAARLCPDPLGNSQRSPKPHSGIQGVLL